MAYPATDSDRAAAEALGTTIADALVKQGFDACYKPSDSGAMVQAFAKYRFELTPAIQPLETAPRDGTMLHLLVDYSEGDHPLEDDTIAWTIGFGGFNDDGSDHWKFAGWCWIHDHFTEGQGRVIGWAPYTTPSRNNGPAEPAATHKETP